MTKFEDLLVPAGGTDLKVIRGEPASRESHRHENGPKPSAEKVKSELSRMEKFLRTEDAEAAHQIINKAYSVLSRSSAQELAGQVLSDKQRLEIFKQVTINISNIANHPDGRELYLAIKKRAEEGNDSIAKETIDFLTNAERALAGKDPSLQDISNYALTQVEVERKKTEVRMVTNQYALLRSGWGMDSEGKLVEFGETFASPGAEAEQVTTSMSAAVAATPQAKLSAGIFHRNPMTENTQGAHLNGKGAPRALHRSGRVFVRDDDDSQLAGLGAGLEQRSEAERKRGKQ